MKRIGQESLGEFCEIHTFWSFLPSKCVNNVCKLLQLLEVFVPPAPQWGTSMPQTPWTATHIWKFRAPPLFVFPTNKLTVLCSLHNFDKCKSIAVSFDKQLNIPNFQYNYCLPHLISAATYLAKWNSHYRRIKTGQVQKHSCGLQIRWI